MENKLSLTPKIKVPTITLDGLMNGVREPKHEKNIKNKDKHVKYYLWICEVIMKYGCKYIIGLGSCAEYQTSLNCEEYKSNLSYSSNYAKQKNELRKALDYLCKSKDVKLGWLRIFALYGPNDKKTSIIYKLINSALNQKICECIPTPRLRDYIFIHDVIEILNYMIKNLL